MLKKVRVLIKTKQYKVKDTLFDGAPVTDAEIDNEPEELEMMMEGSYHDDGTRISISYREGEITGMKNTRTTLSFHKSEPMLISMIRDGSVRTALFFEEGKRHISLYETPFMPFELAVKTKRIKNRIEENGMLTLDYTVELKGASAEHTDFSLQLLPHITKPLADS